MSAIYEVLEVIEAGAKTGVFVAAALIPILTVLGWFGWRK